MPQISRRGGGSSHPVALMNEPITPASLAPILPLVRATRVEMVGKYDKAKYPPHRYEVYKAKFADLSQLQAQDIHDALRWKYGKEPKPGRPVRPIPRNLIPAMNRAAAWFESNRARAGRLRWLELLRELHQRLPIVSATFLAHLVWPEEVPIIDQHNFRAMGDLLEHCDPRHRQEKWPRSVLHVLQLRKFTRALLQACPEFASAQELDWYLMMYGAECKRRTRKPGSRRGRAAQSLAPCAI